MAGGKHGATRVRDELPLGETRSKAGPLNGEQKSETKMSSPGETIRPPLGEAFAIEKQFGVSPGELILVSPGEPILVSQNVPAGPDFRRR